LNIDVNASGEITELILTLVFRVFGRLIFSFNDCNNPCSEKDIGTAEVILVLLVVGAIIFGLYFIYKKYNAL